MDTQNLIIFHNESGWGPISITGSKLPSISIGEYPNRSATIDEFSDKSKSAADPSATTTEHCEVSPATFADKDYQQWILSSPYDIHRKVERVERMCDWLMSSERRGMLPTGTMSGQRLSGATAVAISQLQGQSQNVFAVNDAEDDQTGFTLYDNSKLPRSSYSRRPTRFGGRARYGNFQRSQQNQTPLLGQLKPTKSLKNLERERERQIMKIRKQQGTRHDQKMQQQGRIRRLPTVQVRSDWTVVEEASFSQLAKLSMGAPKGYTFCQLGTVGYYDRAYDKVSTKQEKRLQVTQRAMVDMTSMDDPIVRQLCMPGNKYESVSDIVSKLDEKPSSSAVSLSTGSAVPSHVGDVFATDSILTTLMCCCRSVYPWDLKVTKYNNKIFFDRRTNYDEITVSETSADPPHDEEPSINSPRNLSSEAMLINANFIHQVLMKQSITKQKSQVTSKDTDDLAKPSIPAYDLPDGPNPFSSFLDNDPEQNCNKPDFGGYIYRAFNLSNGFHLYVRCRLDAIMEAPSVSNEQQPSKIDFVSLYALNEWDSKYSNGIDWRSKLDTQRGAVLASELRNNTCKMARWITSSILAGSETLKFGFVSRVHPRDSTRHVIRGVHSFNPIEFAGQMNLGMENLWGIVRWIVDLLKRQPDGTFCLLKDPLKPTIRLYKIPSGSPVSSNANDVQTLESLELESPSTQEATTSARVN